MLTFDHTGRIRNSQGRLVCAGPHFTDSLQLGDGTRSCGRSINMDGKAMTMQQQGVYF